MSCRIDMGKGARRHRCSRAHQELVDGYRAAVEAQELRAEAWSKGYATELAEFYGTQERRVVFKDWLEGSADPARLAAA